MRYLASLAVVVIAQAGAAWALGDLNTARPGATFATVEAANPAACERLCADDTICMAWSFHANACELKATIPAAIAQDGVISGISARAPASLRVRYEPPAPPTPEPETMEAFSEEAFATVAAHEPEDDLSLALLGGPEDEHGLRTRREN